MKKGISIKRKVRHWDAKLGMNYPVRPTNYFTNQVAKLLKKHIEGIKDKE